MAKTAVIAGASGLIGNNLLKFLLDEPAYGSVVILVRKEMAASHPKLKQLVVDYEKLISYSDLIKGDAIFVCLGSTKAKTPDKIVYRKIDHDYPLTLARIALKNNIPQYHLVSAAGASASSNIFYSKMKGEIENDITQLGLPALHIYRPMLLTGGRDEKRAGEKIATAIFKIIDPLLIGGLKKYRSIAGSTVAQTMLLQSLKNETGVFVYASDKIQELSE